MNLIFIANLRNGASFQTLNDDWLADGLLDLFNSHIDQSDFVEYQNSPEYVEKILRGYEAKQQDE